MLLMNVTNVTFSVSIQALGLNFSMPPVLLRYRDGWARSLLASQRGEQDQTPLPTIPCRIVPMVRPFQSPACSATNRSLVSNPQPVHESHTEHPPVADSPAITMIDGTANSHTPPPQGRRAVKSQKLSSTLFVPVYPQPVQTDLQTIRIFRKRVKVNIDPPLEGSYIFLNRPALSKQIAQIIVGVD